jgi:hypothetical protein
LFIYFTCTESGLQLLFGKALNSVKLERYRMHPEDSLGNNPVAIFTGRGVRRALITSANLAGCGKSDSCACRDTDFGGARDGEGNTL